MCVCLFIYLPISIFLNEDIFFKSLPTAGSQSDQMCYSLKIHFLWCVCVCNFYCEYYHGRSTKTHQQEQQPDCLLLASLLLLIKVRSPLSAYFIGRSIAFVWNYLFYFLTASKHSGTFLMFNCPGF